mmetsp:Transcript_21931/g.36295  ORF Transcript_21931/g.36295 Transcript_21931/m.36295 type:complete len:102 (-) Transcript_21931:317-622(-)
MGQEVLEGQALEEAYYLFKAIAWSIRIETNLKLVLRSIFFFFYCSLQQDLDQVDPWAVYSLDLASEQRAQPQLEQWTGHHPRLDMLSCKVVCSGYPNHRRS